MLKTLLFGLLVLSVHVHLGRSAVCTTGGIMATEQTIIASNPAQYDRLGTDSAFYKDRFVMSTWSDTINYNAGSVYIFSEASPDVWVEDQIIYAPGGALAWTEFGNSLGLYETTLAIGSYRSDELYTDSGSVHIYVLVDTTFIQQPYITAPDAAASDRFGAKLSLEGTTLVVCSSSDDDNSASGSGSVYVFQESVLGVADWSFQQKLTSSTPGVNDYWGTGLYLSGKNLIVGAYAASIDGADVGIAGGIIEFFRETSPGTWTHVVKIRPDEIEDDDRFGSQVAIDSNTHTAIAGGRNFNPGPMSATGAVWVLSESDDGTGDWAIDKRIESADHWSNEYFGWSLDIQGYIIAVGCMDNPAGAGSYTGAVYIFTETTTGNKDWVELVKITASDASQAFNFGGRVKLRGETLLVSHTYRDCGSIDDCGAAVFYHLDCNDCLGVTCANGGTCSDGDAAFECACSTGFTDVLCDGDIDDCASSPCMHGGVCEDAGADAFTCECTGTGGQGALCEVDVDECLSSPCENGGICTDAGNLAYTCDCTGTGATGSDCETDLDDCISSPCENTGVCTDAGILSFACDCGDAGFEGATCNEDRNDCLSSPCYNGGACGDAGVNAFACNCASTGFTGHTCEDDVDDCASSPCGYGGTCADIGTNAFECKCGDGFTGVLCDTDVDDCASSPCEHGSVCTDSGASSFTCDCIGTGFEGDLCENDVNDCASSPCANGDCFDDGSNIYFCVCDGTGFEGVNCDIDSNDCTSSPCYNGGTCTDTGANTYQCACPDTLFTGVHCEEPVVSAGTLSSSSLNQTVTDPDVDESSSSSSSAADSPGNSATAMRIVVSVGGFQNEADQEEFLAGLPAALAGDVGGEPADYTVNMIATDDGYEIQIIYANPNDESPDTVANVVSENDYIQAGTTDSRVSATLVNEEEDVSEKETSSEDDGSAMIIIVVIVSIVVLVAILMAAHRYLNGQKKTMIPAMTLPA